MQNEDDGLSDATKHLEGWIRSHKGLFIVLVLLVYIGIMLPTLVFLIKYMAWTEANVCEICINLSRNITSSGNVLPNMTLPV